MPEDDEKNPSEILKKKLKSFFSPQDPQRQKQGLPPKAHFSIWYFLIIFLLITVVQNYFLAPKVENIPYSKFKQELAEGQVNNLVIAPDRITGKLKTKGDKGEQEFTTIRVEDPNLIKELDDRKVNYSGLYESKFLSNLLSWVFPLVIFFLIWRYAMKRMGPGYGVMSFSKSKAKVFAEKETKVTFGDVAGNRRGQGRAPGSGGVPEESGEVPEARGEDPEGGSSGRPARDRENPAGQGGGGGGQGSLLQHQRVGIRGDVRGGRRGAGPRPLLPGQRPGPLHHLHRRAGRPGQGPGDERHGRPRRAGTDAQPAPRGDGRVRIEQGGHHHGGHQPAGDPGPGAAAAGPVRPAGSGGPAGHQRPGGDPEDPLQERAPRPRGGPEEDRRPDPGFRGGGPGQPRERGGAARGPEEKDAVGVGRSSTRPSTGWSAGWRRRSG